MNWTIFLFKVNIETDLPYDSLMTSIKGKSFNKESSFRLGRINNSKTRILYSYQHGLYQKLGYYMGPSIEIVIADNGTANKVDLQFQYSNSILLAMGLIAVSILVFGLVIVPSFGLLWTSLILLTIYFGSVIELNKQLYYFKSDLEQMEESYKRQVGL